MARSEKQKLKLCAIIDFFRRKTDADHPATVTDIINHLAELGIIAERKSVYRDMTAMQQLGYEIVPVHSKHFAYYLNNRTFETSELRLLVDAIQASKFITQEKSMVLIKKLEGLVSEYDSKKIEGQVFITDRIKTSNDNVFHNIDALQSAIYFDSKIIFKYFDWDIRRNRIYRKSGQMYKVSPLALIWQMENYYLIAYDSVHKLIKHYRVDRMDSISMLNEKRDNQSVLDKNGIEKYVKSCFGMYGGNIVTVKLSFERELTNVVLDMVGSGSNVHFSRQDNDIFTVEFDVAITPVFLSWVFMFGGRIKILSPDYVIDDFNKMIRQFIK